MNFPTVSEQLSIIKQNYVDILPEQELINKLELSISVSKNSRINGKSLVEISLDYNKIKEANLLISFGAKL